MPIISERLRELRSRKKLSREQLADKAKISARQIHRLESDAASSNTARERTINQLADALGIEAGVLTGELPVPEDMSRARPEAGERVQTSVALEPEVRLAYDLIKRRYGVNLTTICNLGPLLFALVAEGSLAWRRQKLEEVREAADRLCQMGGGHLSFAFAASRALDAACDEKASISKRDLFGDEVSEDAFDLGYDPSTNNPFADYLRELARQVSDPDVINPEYGDELIWDGPMKGFPEYRVCSGDLAGITGESNEARLALEMGAVRLQDIPDELWAEDAAERRAQWLKERYKEWSEKQPKIRLDLVALLRPEPKSSGEETDQ